MRFCKFCNSFFKEDDKSHWVSNGALKPACKFQRKAYRDKNRDIINQKQRERYRLKRRLTPTKSEKLSIIRESLFARNIQLLSKEYLNNKSKLDLRCLRCNKYWAANWNNLNSGTSCPECAKIARAATNMIKYGVKNPIQNPNIRLKAAKSANKLTYINHWKTNEPVPCQGSFERIVVTYFNKYKIDFEFQSKTFYLSDGSSYTPDFYIKDKDLLIEVKGFFYEDAKRKYELFCKEYSCSIELWDIIKIKKLEALCR